MPIASGVIDLVITSPPYANAIDYMRAHKFLGVCMPSRAQTIRDAIEIFENANYPTGLTPSTAWLGIYQTLLWYEPVNWVGFKEEAHRLSPHPHLPPRLGQRGHGVRHRERAEWRA
jgi:hypothetical protein